MKYSQSASLAAADISNGSYQPLLVIAPPVGAGRVELHRIEIRFQNLDIDHLLSFAEERNNGIDPPVDNFTGSIHYIGNTAPIAIYTITQRDIDDPCTLFVADTGTGSTAVDIVAIDNVIDLAEEIPATVADIPAPYMAVSGDRATA